VEALEGPDLRTVSILNFQVVCEEKISEDSLGLVIASTTGRFEGSFFPHDLIKTKGKFASICRTVSDHLSLDISSVHSQELLFWTICGLGHSGLIQVVPLTSQ
jgi:hypothetical protein